MKTIDYSLRKALPVVAEADVVVVGGGPGGLGAAVMAARSGASVVLIERYGAMGGMAVFGEVQPFMQNHLGTECLDKPVYAEWVERMHGYCRPREEVPEAAGEFKARHLREISKEGAMLAAEDLCLEAGVKMLYHHQLADVMVGEDDAQSRHASKTLTPALSRTTGRGGRRIESLVLLSKSGLVAARGKVYVDATGDGDLAAMGGCEFEMGGASGHCQPMTLCFKLSHVDWGQMPRREEINRLYDQAKAAGEIECPRENVLMFHWVDEDVVHFNTTRVIHKSGVNGLELSEAEIEGRRQMRQIVDFLHRRVAGFERAQFYSIGHHIGVRETRRIKGLAYITRDDYSACRKFPDGIARVRYPIDIHNPDGTGTEIVPLPANDWYEIPFGCLVPKDVRNVLIAGRPISVDHAVHSSMRVMPPACSVGQAAGLGAALAAKTEGDAHAVDGRVVKRMLIERGASLVQ